MSDQIKKFLEDQERLARLLRPSATRSLEETFTTLNQAAAAVRSSSVHQMLEMENRTAAALISSSALDPSRILFAPTSLEYRLADLAAQEAERYSASSGVVRSAMKDYSPFSDMGKSAEALRNLNESFTHTFRLPEQNEAMLLASTAVSSIAYHAASLGFPRAKELCDRMAAMTSPWIDVSRTTTSIKAFTDFQSMGNYANSAGPYEAAASEFFRERLGDWRDTDLIALEDDEELSGTSEQRSAAYADRGVDLSLTNFTADALDESLDLAGLPRMPASRDGSFTLVSAESIDLNTAIYRALVTFEIEVRGFISFVMNRQYGANWITTQVPQSMLEQWHSKKDRALKNWEPERPLIEFADFNDYITIITKKQNWNDIFEKVFMSKQDILETMARLSPVRNQAMHSRILTLEDDMLLRVETGRFYSATRRFIASL